MAIKRYDVVAVTGTYTDADGGEKRRYLNCGVVLETERGLSLKLDAVPTGGDGWFYLFEPDAERASSRASGRPAVATRTPERGPDARTPDARTPAARTPAARTPAARTPAARTPTGQARRAQTELLDEAPPF